LVDGAVHGPEAIGSVAIGQFLRTIDVQDIRGTVIAVPVVNTSGFEFQQRTVFWDNNDLNRQGKGKADGNLTQRLAYHYYNEVISKADAYLDIHTGGPDGYVWYTIYQDDVDAKPEVIAKSREMALAFGLSDVFSRTPWHGTLKETAVMNGIPSITPEIGGGADFFHNGQEQVDLCVQGILNIMRLLDMIDGKIKTLSPVVRVWHGKHEMDAGPHSGVFLREAKWGDKMKKGDVYGTVYHPFTGEKLAEIVAPEDGTVLNSGVVWPVIPPGRWLAILGDLVEEVDLRESSLAQLL
jgi:predicted deacylase